MKVSDYIEYSAEVAYGIILCMLLNLLGCSSEAISGQGITTFSVGKIENVVSSDEYAFSCVYQGAIREYIEYAPEEAKGILFMLHGYGSSAQAFCTDIKMEEDALKRGYAVVYVTGATNKKDSTSGAGWNSGIGESDSDDMGFLEALAGYMQEKYHLTRDNTFAAGFSNGGFMMYRIAVEGQDTFAAVVSVAGMMPEKIWKAKNKTAYISLLQINGTKDDVVPMNSNGTAQNNKAPAIEEVIDYFVSANKLTQKQTEELSEKAELTKYYEEGKTEQVWQVLIKDGRHSWPKENACGFQLNSFILDFLDNV